MVSQPRALLSVLFVLFAGSCADEAPSGTPPIPDAGGDSDTDTNLAPDAPPPQDDDSDSVPDAVDNCRGLANPDQADADRDGVGDLCDGCPDLADPSQSDRDGDGIGDVCDLCPDLSAPADVDSDSDGVGDVCDNCPDDANAGQADFDGDGVGDACEPPLCASEVWCRSAPSAEPVCCGIGDECLEGQCTIPCDFGVRCAGACCDDGELCVEATCQEPGSECQGSTDCPLDAFCDPVFGRCLPIRQEVACQFEPQPSVFEPGVEWSWTGSLIEPSLDQVINMPLVGDLSGDSIPDVLIVTSDGYSAATSRAVLRLLDGATGVEHWPASADVYDPAYAVQSRATPAIGDIDHDGLAEIVTATPTGLIAFEHDGTFKWFATDHGTRWTANLASVTVALADLEGDGSVEIIVAAVVFESDGSLRFDAGTMAASAAGGYGSVSLVADLNGDGVQEVVTGTRAIEAQGGELWNNGEPDGFPAVADFDLDGEPEIAVVSNGEVRIQRGADGVVLSRWPLEATGRGGPPTIADFDADGIPELATANGGAYVVLEFEGSPPALTRKWSRPTQDLSSNVTGSSVFDFEGDGAAEVVYNDECYLRFYSGVDGTVLYEEPNPSATIFEYPVIADVDRDGNTEVIVGANNHNHLTGNPTCPDWPEGLAPRTGLFVYGNAERDWVRTRLIWNEHAYHVTNVNSDLTIPAGEFPSWGPEGFNNYRQSIQGAGALNAPDLVVRNVQIGRLTCPVSQEVSAFVVNQGDLSVAPGIPVAFYGGDDEELLGVAMTTGVIPPGGSERVAIDRQPPVPTITHFLVVVDDDGAGAGHTGECEERNNGTDLYTECRCEAEVCNGEDDDCDGIIDNGFDVDGDGFSLCGGDCDDTDPARNPDAVEICNQVDDDCDGEVDDGANCG